MKPYSLLEAIKTKTIALYPGAFKPPHAGHFSVAQHALKNADEVYIVMSKKSREGVTLSTAKTIWQKYYLPALGRRAKLIIAPKTPVGTVYDMLKKLDGHILLYVGDDDPARYGRVKPGPSQTIKVVPIPRSTIPVSATQFRKAIEAKNGAEIRRFIPQKIQRKDKLVDFLLKSSKVF